MRALVLASVLLALAGCGSTHTSGVTTAKVTSPAEKRSARAAFVAAANAVCAHLKAEEAPLKTRAGRLETAQSESAESESAPIMEQVVALARAAEDKLAAIVVPPEDAAAVEKLLTGFSEEAAYVHDTAVAFRKHERTAWEAALGSLSQVHTRDHGVALGLGLRECTS
ncbi:MAG TPA: hypothetical protein VMB91_04750 [Solirubrobacteraceae bacterium]|nr:hypothetical protein [Solirubrobacteraceae bacterium]